VARSIQELEAEIRSLAAVDRDRLLRDLVADLDGGADPKIEAAWLEEAQRRYGQLKSGKVKAVPAKAVIKKARTRLKHGH
jgi:hypothetical protein